MTRKAKIRKTGDRWVVYYQDATLDHSFDIAWHSYAMALRQALIWVGLTHG